MKNVTQQLCCRGAMAYILDRMGYCAWERPVFIRGEGEGVFKGRSQAAERGNGVFQCKVGGSCE